VGWRRFSQAGLEDAVRALDPNMPATAFREPDPVREREIGRLHALRAEVCWPEIPTLFFLQSMNPRRGRSSALVGGQMNVTVLVLWHFISTEYMHDSVGARWIRPLGAFMSFSSLVHVRTRHRSDNPPPSFFSIFPLLFLAAISSPYGMPMWSERALAPPNGRFLPRVAVPWPPVACRATQQ